LRKNARRRMRMKTSTIQMWKPTAPPAAPEQRSNQREQ
jgi:hypothetical protein